MKKTKKQIKAWDDYRLSLLLEKSKSDDHFEKYITIIASGALGLTITFIDKISPLENAICIWIISIGWFLLTTTLFINLLSHYIASKNNTKAVQDIDDEKKMELKLNEVSNRLAIATTGSKIGIWEYDLTTENIVWDDNMYALYGVKRKKFNPNNKFCFIYSGTLGYKHNPNLFVSIARCCFLYSKFLSEFLKL